jgi:hypothetical protein
MPTRREVIVGAAALAGAGACGYGRDDKATTYQERHSFSPGEPWLDTAGKPIQAHAGSILQLGDRYYWYGENKEFTTGKSGIWTWGIRAYASTDLYNWQDLGLIVPPDTHNPSSPLSPSAGLDRPHILYNGATRRFVCRYKQLKGAHQTQTVLVADAFTGPYRILHSGVMPLGMGAGDFDVCISPDDGKGYMYFERVHTELICADLTDDYTDVTGYYSTHFPEPAPPRVREGVCYFRRHNKHYLITSGTTGYFPNPSEVAVAETFHGPFTVLGNLHPSDPSRTSFNSQISCVLKHPEKKDLYIAAADRWLGPQLSPDFLSGEKSRIAQSAVAKSFASPPQRLTPDESRLLGSLDALNTSQSRYVWLPLRFDGERPFIEWRAQWSLEEFE